jgi:hypothetical protein
LPADQLEALFPNLRASGNRITSDGSVEYNCIAWAVGETTRWWDPVAIGGYSWPDGLPRENTVANWVAAFGNRGFEACENPEAEDGYEKIAIYADRVGIPRHVARRLSYGAWTSKLGRLEDIEHGSLDAFNDSDYGTAHLVLRRPVRSS